MPIVPTKDRPLNMPCDDPEGCKHFKAEMKLQERIKVLEAVYDHPNHDDPKQRYLYEIRCAIRILRSGGEYAFGVAMQLDQFYKRARKTLKG